MYMVQWVWWFNCFLVTRFHFWVKSQMNYIFFFKMNGPLYCQMNFNLVTIFHIWFVKIVSWHNFILSNSVQCLKNWSDFSGQFLRDSNDEEYLLESVVLHWCFCKKSCINVTRAIHSSTDRALYNDARIPPIALKENKVKDYYLSHHYFDLKFCNLKIT